MMLTRRAIYASSSYAFLAAVMAGCSASASSDVQRIATDAQAIATGLGSALTTLAPSISATVLAQGQTYITELENAAKAIAAAASTAAAQTPVGQLMTYVSAFASLVPTSGLPAAVAAKVQNYIAAAQVLIPIISAVVGLAGATPVAPRMTEAQAVMILRN